MTTLAEVRDGLAARLDTIDGLRVYGFVPDDAVYPAAIIDITEIQYTSLQLGASRRAVFSVFLLIPRAIDRNQVELYDFIDTGSRSIMAAVLADPKLGGLDVNAQVLPGSVELDTSQIGLEHLYGRTVNINVFVS